MRLILGSQSPRRREILSYFDLPFEQMKPDFDEETLPYSGGDPGAYAQTLAYEKGRSILRHRPQATVLTADTVVYREGRSFAKAANWAEAMEMLTALAGKWHSVFTGLCLLGPTGEFQGVEETHVLFNALTHAEIERYLEKTHWQDKAGSYAIQGGGSLIIKEIKGCYYNVMGLPVNTLNALLARAGIRLWDHLKKG
jgi:septum formation protein